MIDKVADLIFSDSDGDATFLMIVMVYRPHDGDGIFLSIHVFVCFSD